MFIIRTNFYQIKVKKMMKNYGQLVKINHNPNCPIPTVFTELF